MRTIIKMTSNAGTASQSTGAIPLDVNTGDFNVTIRGDITGTATVEMQYTLDDPFAATFTDAGADWIKHADFGTGKTADFVATMTSPARAIRGYQTAGTGSCTYKILQDG